MELLDFYSEDIYSYPKVHFEFSHSGGVTLILGKDVKLKTSNGSGKTTILKIIFFLIYGKDLNDANQDSIPNRKGSGGYYGYIRFKENGHEFKIERMDKRKDKHPNKSSSSCINFYIDDQLFMTTAEKKDSSTAIQTAIQSKIKMSPKLFTSAILSKRRENKNFLMANDTDKKEILSEILDLIAYSKAFDLVKKDINDIEKRRKEKVIRLESFQEQVKSYQDDIKNQEVLSLNHINEVNDKVKKKTILLNKEKQKYLEVKNKIIKIKNISELEQLKAKLLIQIQEKELLLGDEVSTAKEISELNLNVSQYKKDIKTLTTPEVDENLIKEVFEKRKFTYSEDFNSLKNLKSNLSLIIKEKESLVLQKEEISKNIDLSIDLDSQISDLKIKLGQLDNSIFNIEKDIKILTDDKNNLESTENCPTCLRDYDEEHKKLHIQPIIDDKNKKIKVLSEKLSSLTNEKETLTLKTSDIEKYVVQYKKNSTHISNAELSINILSQILEELIEKQEIFDKNSKEIKEISKQLSKSEIALSKAIEKNNTFAGLKIEFSKLKEELKSIEDDIQVSTNQANLNAQLAKELNSIVENGNQIKKEIEEIKTENNPYLKMIETLNVKINGINNQIQTFQKSIQADDEELHYLKFWQIGFSPAGIRSFISDDLIDLLNQKVQENLNDLYDGALGVQFESESEDSKGVTVNKISTHFHLDGANVEMETLSDGQLNRCVLATDLALMEVAESRSGTWLNVKFLDEPCANMDSAGQLQAFKLFNKLSKQKDGFFVISHDESFQSMCANTIHVLFQGKQSKIVSKDEFKRHTLDNVEDTNIFENKNNDSINKGSKSSNLLKEIVFKKKERKEEED